jgi:hypothetical protein
VGAALGAATPPAFSSPPRRCAAGLESQEQDETGEGKPAQGQQDYGGQIGPSRARHCALT